MSMTMLGRHGPCHAVAYWAAMNGPIIRYTKAADGVDIAYAEFPGEGTPILWVPKHGNLAIDMYGEVPTLLECYEELRCGAPLFVFDARGTGLSGPLLGAPSVEQYTHDVAAVADAIGRPLHLFSLVGGCHAAARFAAEQPPQVLSLTLFNPSPHELMDSRIMLGILGKDYSVGVLVFLRIAFDLGPEINMNRLAAGYARGFSEEALHRLADSAVNTAVDLGDDLNRIVAPVLVVGPVEDNDWPGGRQTAALKPGSTYWKMPVSPFNGALGRALRERFEAFLAANLPGTAASPKHEPNGLSSREVEILGLLASGQTNAQIAEVLTLSEATVATHVRHVLQKTGSANRIQATAYAIRNGLA